MIVPECCRSCKTPFTGRRGSKHAHHSRGLCKHCYSSHDWHGTLDQFERITLTREDRLADIMMLRSAGLTLEAIAKQMGVTLACIEKTLTKSRKVA